MNSPLGMYSTQAGAPREARLLRPLERYTVALLAVVFTGLAILVVNPPSLAGFAWFFCVFNAFVWVFHRNDLEDFSFAYVINSAFIGVFYLFQTSIYPDSYGTTSPLASSWTDDSYFFALAADKLPPNLLVRDFYYLYKHAFTTLIHALSIFTIDHPMDVIFFQSGIAATLATFSKRLTLQLSNDHRLAKVVFVFTLTCPFLMMNGGLILIRDTFAAALLVYSLSCMDAGRWLLALGAIGLQLWIRPGTGLIMLPAYGIIFWPEISAFVRRHRLLVLSSVLLVVAGIVQFIRSGPDLATLATGTSDGGAIGFLGRELFSDLTADQSGNTLFLALQELPFAVKLFANAAYIFLYPFLSVKYAFSGDYFDLRAVTMNLVLPVYGLWLNAWFIAGVLTKVRVARRQTRIVAAVIVGLMLIGTYSLQTRHKTVIYPLYYMVIAIGFCHATPKDRRIGYAISGSLVAAQVVLALR